MDSVIDRLQKEKALGFDDILLLPEEKSNISSRKEVDTTTKISKNVTLKYPIISAPMDTISDVDTCIALNKMGAAGILHRFMPIEEQIEKARKIKQESGRCYVAIGLKDYQERICKLLNNVNVDLFVLDTANINTNLIENFMNWYNFNNDFFKTCGIYLPDLMIGNTLTKESVERAFSLGANSVRHGIGNGCFTPDMQVITEHGLKFIKDIQIGEKVYTHTGKLKTVYNIFIYNRKEEIIKINNEIKCTKNHEIYVIKKENASLVNEYNIHQYAKWIRADELTKDYMLIKIEK